MLVAIALVSLGLQRGLGLAAPGLLAMQPHYLLFSMGTISRSLILAATLTFSFPRATAIGVIVYAIILRMRWLLVAARRWKAADRELAIVLPVYNEGAAVVPVLRALEAAVTTPHELVVVYDFDGDTTVPVIARLAADPELRGLRNDLGRGVLNAMKAGIAGTTAPLVLISMADGSDDPRDVDRMVALARDGADVVAASRYMRGGRQIGGPRLKRLLSRTAGLTLHWFARVPTHDPTSNFKLYSPLVSRELDLDREHGRLRAGAGADREGDARGPKGRRGPDDVA